VSLANPEILMAIKSIPAFAKPAVLRAPGTAAARDAF
jgi:hypothetical protein